MTTLTVRVRPHTYKLLQEFAEKNNESLPDTLDRIVEEIRRVHILREASEAYAAIAADPASDAEWRAEVAAWDVTVGDGLDRELDGDEAT